MGLSIQKKSAHAKGTAKQVWMDGIKKDFESQSNKRIVLIKRPYRTRMDE